jgi:hypothetical protein
MSVRGSPIAPETKKRCFSAEQLGNVENVFNVRPMAGFCKLGPVAVGGGKVSYTAECPNSLVQVEGTATGGSYSVVRTQTPKASKGAAVATKFEGKWVGQCE